jgi:diguanylate cyclase
MLIRIADVYARHARWIILALACLAGAAAALSGWATPLDNRLSEIRIQMFGKEASGETVIVEIDTRSLAEVPGWPWPRSMHGNLVDKLKAAGARQIAFDGLFVDPATDPEQDRLFAAALERAGGTVVLPGLLENVEGPQEDRVEMLPVAELRRHARIASIWIWLDRDTTARAMPYSTEIAGERRPSIAAHLAGMPIAQPGEFPIDWSINPQTFPSVSYADVLAGKFPAGRFAGRNVLVGATAHTLGDRFTVPVHGRIPGLYIQAVGSETLRFGAPVQFSGWPALAVIAFAVAAALMLRLPAMRLAALGGICVVIVAFPILLREMSPFVLLVAPALVAAVSAFLLACGSEITRAVLARLTLTPGSRLPNLTAMALSRQKGALVVAVRLRNHVETAAVLGRDAHADMLRKVYARLALAASGATIFQVDDHSFVWRVNRSSEDTVDAIEGLNALFGSGIPVGGRTVDVTISVGISDDPTLDTEAAVAAALIAAKRAEQRDLVWERYDSEDTDDADWRLSLLGELDRAIDCGDVWLAYQPKYDLRENRVTGAEALVRWSHAERGEVRPDQFIPLLEESGRIEKLTLYVLDRALSDIARLNDDSLTVAVNISMRMIGRNRLVEPLRAMLAQHDVNASRLTLEITESAAMAGADGIEELRSLRALGINISIDDYGTGQSTLSYLKTLPATELKIDRSFVQLILTSRSDATVVDSTVKLAHALGLRVVAEGVESEAVLRQLEKMNCDMVQGFYVGRPVSFEGFMAYLAARTRGGKTGPAAMRSAG